MRWPTPALALNEAERTEVFEVLCSPRFCDRAGVSVAVHAAVAMPNLSLRSRYFCL